MACAGALGAVAAAVNGGWTIALAGFIPDAATVEVGIPALLLGWAFLKGTRPALEVPVTGALVAFTGAGCTKFCDHASPGKESA
jgi:hypothetical protein